MDLNDIDQWSRALLQSEARKRSIRNPEMYSRGELVKVILRHDYGSARGVRGAARFLGGILGSAKSALRAGLGMAEARLEREREPKRAYTTREPERETFRQPAPPVAAEIEVTEPAAESHAAIGAPSFQRAARVDVPAPISPWDEPELAAPSPEQPSAAAASSDLQPSAAEPADFEQLDYELRPDAGLRLRWRVGSAAIHRARAVLGAQGELALRVISVRVEDGSFVRTDTLDHGPIESTGDWTAPLAPIAARYVSSVGLRSGDRFVSIVHSAT